MIIGLMLLLGAVNGLLVVPERAEVTYVNNKYMFYVKIYITRHGRSSPYYINIDGRSKLGWTNNVTVHLFFYEYLHNEYRRSFVELHMKFCDLINKEAYVGAMMAEKGLVCPAPAGEYSLRNMTILSQDFPQVWPFTKGKIMIEVNQTTNNDLILRGYITATFKESTKKKKN